MKKSHIKSEHFWVLRIKSMGYDCRYRSMTYIKDYINSFKILIMYNVNDITITLQGHNNWYKYTSNVDFEYLFIDEAFNRPPTEWNLEFGAKTALILLRNSFRYNMVF